MQRIWCDNYEPGVAPEVDVKPFSSLIESFDTFDFSSLNSSAKYYLAEIIVELKHNYKNRKIKFFYTVEGKY